MEHGPNPDRTIFKYLDTSLLNSHDALHCEGLANYTLASQKKYYFGMDGFLENGHVSNVLCDVD